MSFSIAPACAAVHSVEKSPADAVADAYVAALAARRFAKSTIARYRQVTAHFLAWCAADHPLDLTRLCHAQVQRFLATHLPRCVCPYPGRRSVVECRAALHHLLHVLDAPIAPRRSFTPVDEEVARYDQYLVDVCGAAPNTRLQRIRYVREFLRSVFADDVVSHQALRPVALARFVTTRAPTCRPATAGVIANSLRSYIRYLQFLGRPVDGWRDAIPTVARWRLASIPVHLQPAELERFLHSFDRRTGRGCRDYAMALCLSVLGLRAGELPDLRLRDVDWRAGTLTIRASKTRRARVLPLTPAVGTALVSYLRLRPQTSHDHLFVRVRAWRGEPIRTSLVQAVVRLAYRRAGFPVHVTGTHRLRHTAATQMVKAGVPIKAIADVLGHASLDSTAIYTKVDLPRLRGVALPWIEVPR